MVTERNEGSVLVMLMAISTVMMLTVGMMCCVMGHKYYVQKVKQPIRAEVQMQDEGVLEADTDATMQAFVV